MAAWSRRDNERQSTTVGLAFASYVRKGYCNPYQHAQDNLSVVIMAEIKRFQANERVPLSGVYRVTHHKHRLFHEATLLVNESFPCCRQCGKSVRFDLMRAVNDEDARPFSSGTILEKC